MTGTNKPVHLHFDVVLLSQLAEVMELRENATPDPQRAEAIRELKHIRNLVVHGIDPIDPDQARSAMTKVLAHLLQLEQSSLGTPGARRLRRRTSAQTVHEILNRAEAPAAE
ncbi:MAG: hypothetical protein ACRDQV_14165 [Pseudonocardiaceae bacterium]